MSILTDEEISQLCQEQAMISPFIDSQIKYDNHGARILSYGLSSYGYDARLASEFKIFTNSHSSVIDPKNFDVNNFVSVNTDICLIPPNGFALTHTIEYFKIPEDILVICVGKSTYARCGLIINVTPLEPGWEGFVTLELSNSTPLPARVYANEGICQFIFFKATRPCRVSYAGRLGKYMKQTGITLPSV